VAPVVEDRLAVEDHLHLAVDATDRAQQDVLRVVVGGRPVVSRRPLVVVPPRADQQDVTDDHPAGRSSPACLEDHRAGQVAPLRRDTDVRRAEAERSGVAVEDRPEYAGRVHPRQTQPFERAAGGDQRGDLAVAQERVLRDPREGRATIEIVVLGDPLQRRPGGARLGSDSVGPHGDLPVGGRPVWHATRYGAIGGKGGFRTGRSEPAVRRPPVRPIRGQIFPGRLLGTASGASGLRSSLK
jgi:hypothetical protein